MVRRLGEQNHRKRVRLRDICISRLEILREHRGVAVGPQPEQPRGQRDADDEVDGERAMLQRPELLAGQRLEGDHTCEYCEQKLRRVA